MIKPKQTKQFSIHRSAKLRQKIASAVIFLFLAAPAQSFCLCLKCVTEIYDSYQPVTGSMKPAVEPDACVIVKTRAAVERGSIIVFRHPIMPRPVYVMRLIGVPGDTVELRDGQVFLNGAAVPQVEAPSYSQVFQREGRYGLWPVCPGPAVEGATCEIPQQTETLPNGTNWRILDIDPESYGDNFGPITVPADNVFVLGDHRDHSIDSRFSLTAGGLGFVPVINIIGPVVEIQNP